MLLFSAPDINDTLAIPSPPYRHAKSLLCKILPALLILKFRPRAIVDAIVEVGLGDAVLRTRYFGTGG